MHHVRLRCSYILGKARRDRGVEEVKPLCYTPDWETTHSFPLRHACVARGKHIDSVAPLLQV